MVVIMVKKQVTQLKKVLKTTQKALVSELKQSLHHLNEKSLSSFIQNLLKYENLAKKCKNLKHALIILSLSFYILEQIPMDEISLKLKSRIKNLISKLLDLEPQRNSSTILTRLFEKTQTILNSTSIILIPYLRAEETNWKLLACSELLKKHFILNFQLIMSALARLASSLSFISFFSLLLNPSPPFLPSVNNFEFTVVLDLDETLGHFDGNRFIGRPHVEDFLKSMSKKFELVLFTSSLEVYANFAMQVVDKQNSVVLRLYRQHLQNFEGRFVKNLEILGRNLEKVVIVDNQSKNFALQPLNGIPIRTWTYDSCDDELLKLGRLLEIHLTSESNSLCAVKNILSSGILRTQ
jgi:Dullard-like phosphatase family protein